MVLLTKMHWCHWLLYRNSKKAWVSNWVSNCIGQWHQCTVSFTLNLFVHSYHWPICICVINSTIGTAKKFGKITQFKDRIKIHSILKEEFTQPPLSDIFSDLNDIERCFGIWYNISWYCSSVNLVKNACDICDKCVK